VYTLSQLLTPNSEQTLSEMGKYTLGWVGTGAEEGGRVVSGAQSSSVKYSCCGTMLAAQQYAPALSGFVGR